MYIQMDFKYYCDKCKYGTNILPSYEKHLNTILHATGKRKERCDKKIYECDRCNYKTKLKYNYIGHKLNNHSTKEEKTINYKFYCEKCDYGNNYKVAYEKHIQSKKHNIKTI